MATFRPAPLIGTPEYRRYEIERQIRGHETAGEYEEADELRKDLAEIDAQGGRAALGPSTVKPATSADQFPPFQPLSETSRAAAGSVKQFVPTARDRVLDALRQRALTDEQISSVTGLAPNTVRPRRVELVRQGWIRKVGRRTTESGRMAATWCAIEGPRA